ncbi:MAG: hypothetical protein JM58_14150 [Peptococcaceae bacterium BICA1-8]|nr:MAG: hypothetical protein JM58_14150 [Peptococcaceae bacterium BICA1-8]
MLRVGIPRALSYYKYSPLWTNFFTKLGAEVIVSPPTNKEMLDLGSKYVVDEICLPVKVYFGHVNYLKDKVDYLFVPRIVSVEKNEYTCPKFMGIPDMLVNIDNLPKLIGPTIDLTKNDNKLWKVVLEVGSFFSKSPYLILKAWLDASIELKRYNQDWLNQSFPKELMVSKIDKKQEQEILNIAVIGHEYILYDKFLSMNLLEKLAKLNISVFTTEMVNQKTINKEVSIIPKKIFWNFAKSALGAACYYNKKEGILGFINISSFGCGPDSISNSMTVHQLKNAKISKPILNLTIDEHTGEAGINTRIEAFYDLLKRRVG